MLGDEDQLKKELLSQVAQNRIQDEKGHFVNVVSSTSNKTATGSYVKNLSSQQNQSLIENIPGVYIDKTKDDNTLKDVHVNNPFKKVIVLLEDLKKQKAFMFDIKGSLGLAGILVIFTTFGLFGGGKILCDKGVSTQTGVVRILQVKEADESDLTWLTSLTQKYFNYPEQIVKNRVVLIP